MTYHQPVLASEILKLYEPIASKVIVDGTLGHGGHTLEFLKSGARHVFGIDADPESIRVATQRIGKAGFSSNFTPLLKNFTDIDQVLTTSKPDCILLDLGLNSFQQIHGSSGFSFQTNRPLDMRLNPQVQSKTAADYLATVSEPQLTQDLSRLVQHPYSSKLAHTIVLERQSRPFTTTHQLSSHMVDFYQHNRLPHSIHPATKIFLMLRIIINQEIDNLKTFFTKIIQSAPPQTRVAIITFHSTEDRTVKLLISQNFSTFGGPIKPGYKEIKTNPLSRSAMLRWFET